MAARKLQQEIDKTFKKISEGRQSFDDLYEKIQQTTNGAQKEKLEDNLKREIKKLQRQRDQIKTWCAGNDIKDKKPLMEQRKLIENEMERFKAVEKEMKTKAFSKEGLSAMPKLDPKEQEKVDGIQFLSDQVEELDRQMETLEAEQETLEATAARKGKKDTSKADRLSEIAHLEEQHRWHLGKLELLLRALQNGNVDVEQLNGVKDGIEYYVKENQSVDFMDDETLYDEFDLEADEGGWGAGNDGDKVSSQDAQSNQDDSMDIISQPSIPPKKGSGAEPSVAAARRPSNQLKSPLPALATLHTPATSSTVGGSSASMRPAPPPTRAPGETMKSFSAAAAAAAGEKTSITPLPPPPNAAVSLAQTHTSRTNSTASPGSAHAIPASVHAAVQKAGASGAESITAGRSPSASNAATSSMPPTPALEKSETVSSAKGKVAQTLPATEEAIETSPTSEHPQTPPQNDEAGRRSSGPAVRSEDPSVLHLPPGLEDLFRSFEITKERVSADPSPAALRMLEMSQRNCPDPREADKPQHHPTQHKYTTPSWYPQEPSQFADDPSFYSRIDTDTLFFIFYYRQGTYQQYLAAKSLKNQSWRFHKQYQTWFQRHEEPKTITEEFEQGTYRFFDYESTWMNRRKADFKFVYKFLEDDF